MSWEESKCNLDDHSASHPGSIDIFINAINIILDGIPKSVPADIYISTNDNSVDPLGPVNSPDSFVTKNPDPSFDIENPLVEDFKIHRITSKYSDTTTYLTTEGLHNADTIKSQLDTGSKVILTNLRYIIHNYKPYTYKL